MSGYFVEDRIRIADTSFVGAVGCVTEESALI